MTRLGSFSIVIIAFFVLQPIADAAGSNFNIPRPPTVLSPDQPWVQRGNQNHRRHGKKTKIARKFLPQMVRYSGGEAPGTIIIDTDARFLYLVIDGRRAKRYGVGVGRTGFELTGTHTITRKAEWPSWTPPEEMIARELEKGVILPTFMEGGPKNPLGARALYLGDTLYRIHGSNQPWTIGQAVSSGCIRMRNEDVEDLFARVEVGTKVFVR